MTSIDFTAQASLRTAILKALGAAEAAQWFAWPTASAVLDTACGALLIVTDAEPAPDDWDAIVALIELAGFDNGQPGYPADPGEPVMTQGLCLWRLEIPVLVS